MRDYILQRFIFNSKLRRTMVIDVDTHAKIMWKPIDKQKVCVCAKMILEEILNN